MEPHTKSGAAKYIVGLIIVGLIIVGVSLWGMKNTAKTKSDYSDQSRAVGESSLTGNTVEVTYTNTDGFTPDNVSIKIGDTVKFVNKSFGKMWIASDEHPTHMEYDGTNLQQHCAAGATPSFDQCGTGTTYSFTFTKAGKWDYHNHTRSRIGGTIIVK